MRSLVAIILIAAVTGCSLLTEPDTVKSGKACSWVADTSHSMTPNRDSVTVTVARRACP